MSLWHSASSYFHFKLEAIYQGVEGSFYIRERYMGSQGGGSPAVSLPVTSLRCVLCSGFMIHQEGTHRRGTTLETNFPCLFIVEQTSLWRDRDLLY